jgi:hypothetical protein
LVHLGLTLIVLVVGLAAPWMDLKVRGTNLKPFVYAFLVVLGIIPFNHWLLITPNHHRDSLIIVSALSVCSFLFILVAFLSRVIYKCFSGMDWALQFMR